ncbi:HPP family protein [Chloroflexota bacterium]
MEITDKSFLKRSRNYIFQSLLAVAVLAIILYFVENPTHATIDASTFIVFTKPDTITAQPRKLIGGNIVGMLYGLLFYYAFFGSLLGGIAENVEYILYIPGALAVGLSIFLRTIINTKHPLIEGNALGVVTHEWSFQTIIFILLHVVSLAIVKRLPRGCLKTYIRADYSLSGFNISYNVS